MNKAHMLGRDITPRTKPRTPMQSVFDGQGLGPPIYDARPEDPFVTMIYIAKKPAPRARSGALRA